MELTKTCRKCGIEKDSSEFSKNSRYRDGLQSYCKSCVTQCSKEWDKKNPDRRRKIMDRWRAKNKELLVQLATAWNKSHPERKREINRDWNHKHPKQVRLLEKNRELRERDAPGRGVFIDEWNSLIEDYGNRCVYCNRIMPLEADHVIPISGGGAHEIENIVPACRQCNASKCDKSLLAFLYARRYERVPVIC